MSSNDSTTKQYWIYTLTNPLNNSIFYLGVTRKPKLRFTMHATISKYEMNNEKLAVLQAIRAAKQKPVMSIIDTFKTEEYRRALEIENLWVCEYLYRGEPLTNKETFRLRERENRSYMVDIEYEKSIAEMSPSERSDFFAQRRKLHSDPQWATLEEALQAIFSKK